MPIHKKCPVKRYNANKLEAAILRDLEALCADPQALADALLHLDPVEESEKDHARIEQIRAALAEIEPQVARLIEAIENRAHITSLEKRLRERDRQAQELRAELMLLEAQKRQAKKGIVDLAEAQKIMLEIWHWLQRAKEEERRNILSLIVDEIEAIDKKAVHVSYNFPTAPPPENLDGSQLCKQWLPGLVLTQTFQRQFSC